MPSRQPVPRRWLMTDERMGEALWRALAALPRDSGIVFRHYATPAGERRRIFDKVRRIARRRGLVLVLAGTPGEAIAWRADGEHGRRGHRRRHLLRTAPVHDAREARGAMRIGADLIFVSPVFATQSHPGARPLGPLGFARLATASRARVIALGGMTERRFRRLAPLGAHGWAAIDAWT